MAKKKNVGREFKPILKEKKGRHGSSEVHVTKHSNYSVLNEYELKTPFF